MAGLGGDPSGVATMMLRNDAVSQHRQKARQQWRGDDDGLGPAVFQHIGHEFRRQQCIDWYRNDPGAQRTPEHDGEIHRVEHQHHEPALAAYARGGHVHRRSDGSLRRVHFRVNDRQGSSKATPDASPSRRCRSTNQSTALLSTVPSCLPPGAWVLARNGGYQVIRVIPHVVTCEPQVGSAGCRSSLARTHSENTISAIVQPDAAGIPSPMARRLANMSPTAVLWRIVLTMLIRAQHSTIESGGERLTRPDQSRKRRA